MMKTKHPIVTVYITNHNYGNYIGKAIESILGQEFQDFELIIIDDGSSDDSLKIINKYEGNEKVHIVRQKNKGLIVSNNIALRLADGDYIIRLDADDYFDPMALQVMVNTLELNKSLALVFPDYYEIDEYDNILKQVRRHDFEKDVTLFDQPANGACTMIRKSILLEIGGYDESFTRQDGYDVWLGVIGKYPIKNINLPLFYYRQHSNSLTKNEKKLLETRSQVFSKHAEKSGKKLSVLGIIPVRGNKIDSRSQPLEKLGNRFLIDWTVENALFSKNLTDIIVTTPDQQLIKYINDKYKSKVICHERTSELARINQSLYKTLKNDLEFYESNNVQIDALMILSIEAPFRTSMYLNKSIDFMKIHSVDSVIGVRKDDDIFYNHDGQGLVPNSKVIDLRLEREYIYKKAGGISLVNKQYFLDQKKIFGGRLGHIQLDQKAAFVIKSQFDWCIAEALAGAEV